MNFWKPKPPQLGQGFLALPDGPRFWLLQWDQEALIERPDASIDAVTAVPGAGSVTWVHADSPLTFANLGPIATSFSPSVVRILLKPFHRAYCSVLPGELVLVVPCFDSLAKPSETIVFVWMPQLLLTIAHRPVQALFGSVLQRLRRPNSRIRRISAFGLLCLLLREMLNQSRIVLIRAALEFKSLDTQKRQVKPFGSNANFIHQRLRNNRILLAILRDFGHKSRQRNPLHKSDLISLWSLEEHARQLLELLETCELLLRNRVSEMATATRAMRRNFHLFALFSFIASLMIQALIFCHLARTGVEKTQKVRHSSANTSHLHPGGS